MNKENTKLIKFLSFALLGCSILSLGGCQKQSSKTNDSSSAESSSSQGDSSQGESSSTDLGSTSIADSSSSNESGNEYDTWCNSWSKPGHAYFHYNRGADKDDYNNYCLWLWQFAPQNLEGSLWAYSGDPVVSPKLTLKPMSTAWMTPSEVGKSESSTYFKDEYGVIVDVDLYKSGLVGGKTGKATTFEGAQEVGFLFVQQSSMDGTTNWTSDGGRETYIDEFGDSKNWRTLAGGGTTIHIFVSSGALNDYSFYQGDGVAEVKINPLHVDTTGQYGSKTSEVKENKSVAPTSNAMKDKGVGYQIFVSSFRDSNGDGIGDIRGIIDSLEYLSDLGAEVLWLTPIQQSDSYHGYDISDYYAVDKRYGTIEDYRELIYKAHEKGMKVLMDLVLNHTSRSNVWYTKSQWGVNSSCPGCETDNTGINWRNIYTWKYKTDTVTVRTYDKDTFEYDGGHKTITVEEDSKSKGPSWYRDGESSYYYYGKFSSGMPELNYENQETRDLVINMAKYWLSFGLDGFRLDAVKHIYMEDEVTPSKGDVITVDTGSKEAFDDEKGDYITKPYDYSVNLTKNVNWWKYFSNELKAVFPNCFLVGENFDGWGTRIAPYYQALDSQFDFATYYHIPAWLYNAGGASNMVSHAKETYDSFQANSISSSSGISTDYGVIYPDFTKTSTVDGGCRPDFINGAFTSNHDVMRAINQANATGTKEETKANDNVSSTNGTHLGKAKVAAATTILNPGVSWIYYGDELGMSSNTTSHKDKYGNENCLDIWYRQPFLWNDTAARPNYKHGQYEFELDSNNQNLLSSGQGINYSSVSGGSTYQVSTNNEMYKFYKSLIEIKKNYPLDAKISFDGSSENVLVINVWGSGKSLKIYISTGYNNSDYLINPDDSYGTYSLLSSIGGTFNKGSNIGSTPYSVVAFKAN